MNAKSPRSFRWHLSIRLLVIGSVIAILSASTFYLWQSQRDLNNTIETIRHVGRLINDESISINLGRKNTVFLEDALRRLNAVRPIVYSYVIDRRGMIAAISGGGVGDEQPCCFAWEPPLSIRPNRDYVIDVRTTDDGEAPGIRVPRGERLILLGLPVLEHSSGDLLGTLTVVLSGTEALQTARIASLRLAAILFALEVLIGVPSSILVSGQLSQPMDRIRALLERTAGQAGANEALLAQLRLVTESTSVQEFDLLRQRLLELHEAIRSQEDALRKSHASASLGEFASQVAHDIRSPLSSLQVALGDSEFTESSRILVRGAVRSIREIAERLVYENRKYLISTSEMTTPTISEAEEIERPGTIESISLLLDKIVRQKQIELRDRKNLDISCEYGSSAYAIFSVLDSVVFEQVVSNLINNAVEAISGSGQVTATVYGSETTARIVIMDTGRGIPTDVLPRLTQRGVTVGKALGSGLGLFHARESIESWGGRLAIESKVGEGTRVSLTIPAVDPPPWFPLALRIPATTSVVIVDDDAAAHALWNRRLDEAGVPASVRYHATTPNEVMAWFRVNLGSEALYLFDYEFRGHRDTGLDLIERLGVKKSAVLVTHRADEEPIRSKCVKLNVALLPKPLVPIIPIET